MTKHTPGKLIASGNRVYMGAAVERREVAVATKADPVIRYAAEANAAHIAACWNACEGINPEAVPMLLDMAELMSRKHYDDSAGRTCVDMAIAALAKAKGQA